MYVDDIVVKTKVGATLIDDLRETFASLNKYRIKLNPKKCVFGVLSGQLLGYLVSARGIEANPDKIKAILAMKEPTNVRGVLQLAGRVAALSRFVGRMGEKALPFYQQLKKSEKFEWTPEASKAFADLKHTLANPPVLTAPHEHEPMFLYIAATKQVVSTVLVVERAEEGKAHGVQRPVYYLSEVLTPTKQRYPHYQKLAYGVYMTAKKLKHYFQEHPIVVVSEAPLSDILNNSDATGRSPYGESCWVRTISPTRSAKQSNRKLSLTSSTSGWKSKLQVLQICRVRGPCTSTGPRDMAEPRQELFSSLPEETRCDTSSR